MKPHENVLKHPQNIKKVLTPLKDQNTTQKNVETSEIFETTLKHLPNAF
jgi:hypothetical protein